MGKSRDKKKHKKDKKDKDKRDKRDKKDKDKKDKKRRIEYSSSDSERMCGSVLKLIEIIV